MVIFYYNVENNKQLRKFCVIYICGYLFECKYAFHVKRFMADLLLKKARSQETYLKPIFIFFRR